METDTPETDAMPSFRLHLREWLDFARRLERERNAAMQVVRFYATTPQDTGRAARELLNSFGEDQRPC